MALLLMDRQRLSIALPATSGTSLFSHQLYLIFQTKEMVYELVDMFYINIDICTNALYTFKYCIQFYLFYAISCSYF